MSDTSAVAVLTTEKEIVTSLMEGQKGTIFVEKTPFATMGGQEGDTGVITGSKRNLPGNYSSSCGAENTVMWEP